MTLKQEKQKNARQKDFSAEKPKQQWVLNLYVAGKNQKAVTALKNITTICEDLLKGRYRIEVIDLLKHPLIARKKQILALPTLMRNAPLPVKKIIGDLSDTEKVLQGLNLFNKKMSKLPSVTA
ncbi:MAG: circadian clock KaiB family protein [Bacteroidota bacterium]